MKPLSTYPNYQDTYVAQGDFVTEFQTFVTDLWLHIIHPIKGEEKVVTSD